MKKSLVFPLIIGLFVCTGFAQDLSKKVFENPLDTGLFLANSKNGEYRKDEILSNLAKYYWKLGRYKDALDSIDLISENYYDKTFKQIYYGKELIKLGKTEEAALILLQALKKIEIPDGDSSDDIYITDLLRSLIKMGKSHEVVEFADSVEDVEDQAHILTRVAELLVEKGQKEKPLEMLSKALEVINKSEWEDFKLFTFLEIGNVYAKLGEREKALEFLDKVLENYRSVESSNISNDSFETKIVENYETLKDFDKAVTFIEVNGDLNDSTDLSKLADLSQKAGKKEKANALLIQAEEMQNAETNNNFYWTKIIDESFKSNDFTSTLAAAKKTTSDNHRLDIVDKFIAQNRFDLAMDLLNFSLKITQKIETNQPESGSMSTSPQMQKANDLSEIAGKFAEIKQFGTALQIIGTIEKPYYKAQALTNLAVRQNSKNSAQYLELALAIVQKTEDSSLDAGRINVWCEIAKGFAKIGRKDKATEIFAEILMNKDITSSSLDDFLFVGFSYESAGLKSDERISSALKQFIKNWEEDN